MLTHKAVNLPVARGPRKGKNTYIFRGEQRLHEDLTASQLRRGLWAVRELAEVNDLADYPRRVTELLRELIGAD